MSHRDDERIDLKGAIPFALMHLACLGAFFVDVNPVDWLVCLALYYARMVGITAGYHRYFSHRTYKVGRGTQLFLAALGGAAAQKGALWWAAHHRVHHKFSDTAHDVHSPKRGFWWSHLGWILCKRYVSTDWDKVKEFTRYPELMWLERHYLVVPTLLAIGCFLVGGWSMLFVGFFLSTVLCYHGTFTINSLAHVWGRRRYETTDTSRNNFILALVTCGEGWHNNHHHYPSAANQGFFWWELDISYAVIRALGVLGLAWDIRTPTPRALRHRLIQKPARRRVRASRLPVPAVGRDAV